MQPVELKWDWRDIPNAGRRALSARKIALHARGVLLSYALLVVMFYAGSMVSGIPFGVVWEDYGLSLLRLLFGEPPSRLAFAAIVAAAIATVFVSLHYGTAVCRLTFAQLRGDYFYSARSAQVYANRHRLEAAQTVAFFVVAVAAFRFAVFVFSALGRIPIIGEWLASLSAAFLVPVYVAGLAMAFFTVLLAFASFMSPAIVGVVGGSVVETTYQLFTTLWNQPWRLIGYSALVAMTQFVAMGTLYAMSAWGLFSLLDSAVAGYAPLEDAYQTAANIVWGGQLPVGHGFGWRFARSSALSPAMSVAATLATLSFLAITVVWIAYGFAIASVGSTLAYVNLRRRIRGDNVLEITPEVLSDDADVSAERRPDPASGASPSATASPLSDDGAEREPAE